MAILNRLRRVLAEPRLKGLDLDSPARVAEHRKILSEKPLLRAVFREFYTVCRELDQRYLHGEGKRIEIGAGSGLFKVHFPDVLLTDIVPAEHLDFVLDAEQMPLPDASVRAFYAINCFHHFAHPEKFFAELLRVLVPGGGCILLEPYYGPLAAAFFRRVFRSETFDANQPGWSGDGGPRGAMTDANQALSYLVFHRDVARFRTQYPKLEIVHQQVLRNYLRYAGSGGLNYRQLSPNCLAPLLRLTERALIPLEHWCALHHAIVLRRSVVE